MSNYIDISKQQRVVFVDNIRYDDAKSLSMQYPFATIFTSAEDDVYHTIWRNGYCYSYVSEIDKTPITIDKYSISLNIDRKGKLSLNVGSAISDFNLIGFTSNNGPYNQYPDNSLNIKNFGELYFEILGKDPENQDNIIQLTEYNRDKLNLFDFELRKGNEIVNLNDYIKNIQSKKDSSNIGIKYYFDVEQEYLENDLTLLVSYNLLGITKTKEYPIILRKTLDKEFYWIGSGDPRTPYSIPNEITNAYLIDNPNWRILNEIVNCNDHPIYIEGGNIWVIIPTTKYLRVQAWADNPEHTLIYIIDEGEDDSYSYTVMNSDITINNVRYKLLRLNDTHITEFTNIIQ